MGAPYSLTYQAAAAANVVVRAEPAFLHAIIIGTDVLNSVVEVSDSATDGDGNVKILLNDPTVGTYLVDGLFDVGITADLTLQTNVTFVWK
jgi:hypothetical protein